MHPRISINTISTLAWPLADDLALLQRLGAGCFGFPLLKIEDDIAAGLTAIKSAGLAVSSVAASTTKVDMRAEDRAMAALKPAIDAAAELGSTLCYFTSGRTPERMTTDDACAGLVSALPPAVAYARSKGIRLAVENNSITNRDIGYVHTLHDAFRVSEEAGIGVCLELQNCWYERDLDRLFRENVERIAIVQVSDFKVGESLKLNRRVPGDGSMPLPWMLGALLDAGYEGVFDIEIIGPAIDAEGPETALKRAIAWMEDVLRELGA